MDTYIDRISKSSLSIVTYRDIFQHLAKERDYFGLDYQERSAVLQMHPKDLKVLKIKTNDRVSLRNDYGAIVVRALPDLGCQIGYGYMPVSPYSNCLISYEPVKAKLPNFKLIEVEIEFTDQEVTPISCLLNSLMRKGEPDA